MDKWKFAEHQIEGKLYMDSNECLAIWWAMGTGKTALALWWIRDAIRDGRIARALVVCPASLVPSWNQGVKDMIKFEGFDEEDVALLKERVVITSFQKTYRVVKKAIHHRNGTNEVMKRTTLREEVDRPWGAVIIDEAHSIGAYNSKQTGAAITLSKLAKYRYAMTATPVHGGGGNNDFAKLYGQLQFLTKGRLWANWSAFKSVAVTSFDPWGKPRSYNKEYCQNLMANYGIVCRLEDCFDMPGSRDVELDCPLEEVHAYKDMKDMNMEPYGLDVNMSGQRFTKMLQVCSGSIKTPSGTLSFKTSKLDVLEDVLNGTEDQVVIFCNYVASIDKCVELCRKLKKRVDSFDGRSQSPTWEKLRDGKVDVLVCQYQSGGAGLNLQTAHIMVLFEPTMSSLLLDQARGRIYRNGQNKKCIYYILDTPRTLEHKVWEKVRNGMDVNNDLLEELAYGDDVI